MYAPLLQVSAPFFMRYCVWQFGHSTYRRVVDIGCVQPPAPAELSLQAYPALKILYVWYRTSTETPMVHCTLNGPYLSSQAIPLLPKDTPKWGVRTDKTLLHMCDAQLTINIGM